MLIKNTLVILIKNTSDPDQEYLVMLIKNIVVILIKNIIPYREAFPSFYVLLSEYIRKRKF